MSPKAAILQKALQNPETYHSDFLSGPSYNDMALATWFDWKSSWCYLNNCNNNIYKGLKEKDSKIIKIIKPILSTFQWRNSLFFKHSRRKQQKIITISTREEKTKGWFSIWLDLNYLISLNISVEMDIFISGWISYLLLFAPSPREEFDLVPSY